MCLVRDVTEHDKEGSCLKASYRKEVVQGEAAQVLIKRVLSRNGCWLEVCVVRSLVVAIFRYDM